MLSKVKKYLQNHPWQDQIQYFDTLDSTNTCAKQMSSAGAPEGTVIIAGHQTGGRGRMGRSFSSPAGMGIYMSMILRPGCPPEQLMHLTCAAGVAACKAVENATGFTPRIKWTNDLVLGNQKLGGILTELSIHPITQHAEWAVIGIGINCCQRPQDFPPELHNMACSLGIEPQKIPSLTAELILQLWRMNDSLLTGKASILEAFTQRCITIGSDISILRGNEVRYGRAIGVDENGGLSVRYTDGTEQIVTSGEVSIRGMYGYV